VAAWHYHYTVLVSPARHSSSGGNNGGMRGIISAKLSAAASKWRHVRRRVKQMWRQLCGAHLKAKASTRNGWRLAARHQTSTALCA